MLNKLISIGFIFISIVSFAQEPSEQTKREQAESFLLSIKDGNRQEWLYDAASASEKADELLEKNIDLDKLRQLIDQMREVKSQDGARVMLIGRALVNSAEDLLARNLSLENFQEILAYIGSIKVQAKFGETYAYSPEEAAAKALKASKVTADKFREIHNFFLNLKVQNTFIWYPDDTPVYRPRSVRKTIDRSVELLEKNIDFEEFKNVFQYFYDLRDNDKGYALYYREDAVAMAFAALDTPGFNLETFSTEVSKFKDLTKPEIHKDGMVRALDTVYRFTKSFSPWAKLDSMTWQYVGRAPIRKAVESLGIEFSQPELLEDL